MEIIKNEHDNFYTFIFIYVIYTNIESNITGSVHEMHTQCNIQQSKEIYGHYADLYRSIKIRGLKFTWNVNTRKRSLFYFFYSQRKIHKSCIAHDMTVALAYTKMSQMTVAYSVDCGILMYSAYDRGIHKYGLCIFHRTQTYIL